MSAIRVLFICQHNSARSQMAEEFLRMLGGDRFEAHSAGLEPTEINPLVIETMKDEGVDLTGKGTRDVFEIFKNGELFQYVITVCSAKVDTHCPTFPGMTTRLNWPFPDPARLEGSEEEQLAGTRIIRDNIKARIAEFVAGNHV